MVKVRFPLARLRVSGGNNDSGQATPPGGAFSQVAAGAVHTCGLKRDGTVACWGHSTFGETTPPGALPFAL